MNEPTDPEVAILNGALELPEAQRDAYLDQACAGDAALRRQIETLLQSHEQAKGFLEAPPTGMDFKRTALVNIPLTEKPGDRIGRYKLLQQIGEGGCGVVYMAEQEEPVRRRVALKVIKLGLLRLANNGWEAILFASASMIRGSMNCCRGCSKLRVS